MISTEIGRCTFELVQGDITAQDTEAVVNAANKRLAPGGGVAGAIHRKAGHELWEECKELRGCETGEAKITKGYNLKADYVIHTVGPIYSGSKQDIEDLKNCYKNSLKIAIENGIKSISFPAISTGAFGYPVDEASRIAIETISNFLEKNDDLELVRLVLYSDKDYKTHEGSFRDIL